MSVTNVRALLRRGLALLAVLAERLAPPVVGISLFRHPAGVRQVRISLCLFTHLCFPITAITGDVGDSGDLRRALRAATPTPMASTMIPLGLAPGHPSHPSFNRSPIPLDTSSTSDLFRLYLSLPSLRFQFRRLPILAIPRNPFFRLTLPEFFFKEIANKYHGHFPGCSFFALTCNGICLAQAARKNTVQTS